MTLSPNVLNHLGINLYTNVPAVLAETVANAWDADAEHVWIAIGVRAGMPPKGMEGPTDTRERRTRAS
jgi:hypothetical protein